MLALVLFLAVVPVLSFYIGTQYAETVRIVSEETLTLTLVPVRETTPIQLGMREYRGAWFAVRYPEKFTLTATGTDEATFSSPDGEVSMYVFSPQWIGESQYLDIGDGEMLVSDKTVIMEEPESSYPVITTRQVTYRSEDGSYSRSAVSVKRGYSVGNTVTHHVFGIGYKTGDAYEMYRETYRAFTESLVQYAD